MTGPPESDALNGWKEVAAYLGKSVRAVQRWEHFGLPVHRIKTPTGQVVYALKHEIDEWRQRSDVRSEPADDTSQPEFPAEAIPSRINRWRGSWMLLPGTVLLLVAIGATTVGYRLTKRDSTKVEPTKFVLTGNALEALAPDGHVRWRHVFDRPLSKLRHTVDDPIDVVDTDDDGVPEVLVRVHLVARSGEESNAETLVCFERDGRIRWTYTPDLSLTFDGRRFDGPWRLYDVMVSTPPAERHVWVSFGHHTWWPSAVAQIDTRGRATITYVQSGAVYELAQWNTPSGSFIIAGGVNNEYARASIAVLPTDGLARTSPQTRGSGYYCDGCPPSPPHVLLLLPPSELNVASGHPYNRVAEIRQEGESIRVDTNEYQHAGLVFFLDKHLRATEATPNDHFNSLHHQLQNFGKVTHNKEQCLLWPPGSRIRRWTPERGWTAEELPHTISSRRTAPAAPSR